MNGKKSMSCSPKSPSTVVARKKRIRNTPLHVWLSLDERAKIQERMADAGIKCNKVFSSVAPGRPSCNAEP